MAPLNSTKKRTGKAKGASEDLCFEEKKETQASPPVSEDSDDEIRRPFAGTTDFAAASPRFTSKKPVPLPPLNLGVLFLQAQRRQQARLIRAQYRLFVQTNPPGNIPQDAVAPPMVVEDNQSPAESSSPHPLNNG